ncbi:MAG: DNA mismatch repair protein MutS [Spirochaetaceae bacterium]|jgi:DNA mismatch repair protein MutS|nr:DNA mismatch repair protein MutS [Spirochaetaceae bacterium]
MLEQYNRIKREHQGSVLFFRLGDFYEMFADDALEVSSLLNLTLTSRNGLPMCGLPCHAARGYIARLLRYGKKIAVCEQVSGPGLTKLMDRKVMEVITPGTIIDEDYLEKGSSNYLASLAPAGKAVSFSYIDLSAGDFYATSFPAEEAAFNLALELERLEIREMIVAESLFEEMPALTAKLQGRPNLVINRWADWLFDRERARERLCRQFKTAGLKGFGLDDTSPELLAAGALLDYLGDTAKSLIPHVSSLSVYGKSEFVEIDEASQCNLELVRNLRDGTERYSLFEILDETKTAMGRRLLKRRLLHPLKNVAPIERRLDLLEKFYRDQEALSAVRSLLAKTPDLERLSSRLAMDKAHGKDLVSLQNAMASLGALAAAALEKAGLFESPGAASFSRDDFAVLEELRSLLERGLCENPSVLLTEGGLIRDGYNEELDRLKQVKDHGRQMLEDYLETEKKATGIPSLKIRYNRLIGYFFEVTKTYLSRVPPRFIRRQGTVAGERFTTDTLARLESEINSAADRIVELEKKLFLELREKAKVRLDRISAAARLMAELDTAQSLAWAATIRGWTRPELDIEKRTAFTEGRHPVVEAHLPGGEFIPNDLYLDGGRIFFALITGPNMAGKSTYLRQAALITIMAQIGSFVPARDALIGITDRIYCRVGSSDNLARGESTFLVEMNETAHILHTATEKSLVIMDEVGRGTGTTDGLAIAWAVCEDLLERIQCRTLFATHFHELSQMEKEGLANRSMEVLERDGKIIFLRKLREGPAAESYGLHVAGLAGIPAAVLERARAVLDRIREKDSLGAAPRDGILQPASPAPGDGSQAPPFLTPALAPPIPPFPPGTERIIRELAALDPDNMTPLEALTAIHRWKGFLRDGETGIPAKKENRNIKKTVPAGSAELFLFDE